MRADRATLAGLGIVAAAAAVLSFDALRQLALMSGTSRWLAPLYPLALDAAAVAATRVWLQAGAPNRARAHARALALVTLGLSVAGNAAQHALTAWGQQPAWWLVVTVSAVPPAVLGATAHLAALVTHRPSPEEQDGSDGAAENASSPAAAPGQPDTPPAAGPASTLPQLQPAATTTAGAESGAEPAVTAAASATGDEEALNQVRALWPLGADRPARRTVQDTLGCGSSRASRLLGTVSDERTVRAAA